MGQKQLKIKNVFLHQLALFLSRFYYLGFRGVLIAAAGLNSQCSAGVARWWGLRMDKVMDPFNIANADFNLTASG
eukprot:5124226-Amphidinium_carterae.1